MIKIDESTVWGFESAMRGMRNPYESHDKSDSFKCETGFKSGCIGCGQQLIDDRCTSGEFVIGKADTKLAKKLIDAGVEHRKFLRMIHVQADVTAPRYWWAEMDKYKWVEANSSSTMHLITKRHLRVSDFSTSAYSKLNLEVIVGFLNKLIDMYNIEDDRKTKNEMFIAIKQLLPESFNQLRTIDTNYECLLSIYNQRKNHRLPEWVEFCNWIASLPYMKEFIDG